MKNNVNTPFIFVVKLFFWLIIGAIILLYITACGSPAPQTIAPSFMYQDPTSNEVIYWSMSQTTEYPYGDNDYYVLSSWYVETEPGYLQLVEGVKFLHYQNSGLENRKEFYLR